MEQDVRYALSELGPRTKKAVGHGLGLFLKIMGRLGPRIADDADSQFLQEEVLLLLRCLSRPTVREAAFEDAWRSFLRADRRAERCELRLLQLRELVEHAGFDWNRICNRLDAILEDYRRTIAKVDPTVAATGTETAGLSERRRLTLCKETVVGSEAGRGDYVVWLLIDHPAMPEPWVSLGPIDIFAGELWPSELKPGGRLAQLHPEFVAPTELEDERGLQSGTDRLELAEVLFARVSLTEVPPGSAARRARELLESTIHLASPESTWRPYEGEMIWNPDGGWSGSSLLSPDAAANLRGPVPQLSSRPPNDSRSLTLGGLKAWQGGIVRVSRQSGSTPGTH
ncbi:MAG: hypothetical protein M3335_00565 [Actinomycetota bacterium]|nr:hypothetical protein [Actinomycetota bacterium]